MNLGHVRLILAQRLETEGSAILALSEMKYIFYQLQSFPVKSVITEIWESVNFGRKSECCDNVVSTSDQPQYSVTGRSECTAECGVGVPVLYSAVYFLLNTTDGCRYIFKPCLMSSEADPTTPQEHNYNYECTRGATGPL